MRMQYALYAIAFCIVFGAVIMFGKSMPSGPVTRILFIGNSFTYVYDVPKQFVEIAESKGKRVEIGMAAPPGVTFHQHLSDPNTLTAIAEQPWDYVVLQEQSQHFSFSHEQIERESNPDARALAAYIHAHAPSAKIMFYETWGEKAGDQHNCLIMPEVCSYNGMQRLLILNYHAIANELGALLVPVGEVWQQVRSSYPTIELYDGDGHHQSDAGAYLAACTFFRTIFHENVTGASRNAMSAGDAAAIQQAVDHVQPY